MSEAAADEDARSGPAAAAAGIAARPAASVTGPAAGPFAGRGIPRYLIVFFGALVALGPLSMDAYLPAIPSIAAEFGVGIVSVNNTLSVFLLGYALGQFFGGAFSDQLGRKRIGYIGLGVYVASCFAMAAVTSVEQMLMLRVLQALGGGFSTVICMASVRDIYPMAELGRRFATVTMIVLVAPLVAPTLGSLLLPLGWQAIFLFKGGYASLLLLLYVFLIPETQAGRWRNLSVLSIFRQCVRVVTRRVDGRLLPLRYALAMALAASVLMNFVTNASLVYMDYFGISARMFPWIFGISVLGFMSMNLFSMHRLSSANSGNFFRCGLRIQLAAVLALLVVVETDGVTLFSFVPLLVVAMSMLGLITPAGSARYMAHFSGLSGSASSVYMTAMFSFGGFFGAATGFFYAGSLLPMVLLMTVSAVLANLVAPTNALSATARASDEPV